MNTPDTTYSIPAKYRKMENLHIVFWLFKDIAWCMVWRVLGIAMIIPTLSIAIIIMVRTWQVMSERCHNLAIVVWIMANSYWMISEFLHFDALPVYGSISFKHLALVPFVTGLLVLAYYYAWWKPRHHEPLETL